jgi:adenylate kinase family enzyme
MEDGGVCLMLVKVFVLGRPGSGKTTAMYHLLTLARQRNYSALSIDDYNILHRMSQQDTQHIQFRSTTYDGFDVLDPTVFDTALEMLEQQVQNMAVLETDGIITIEFARNDYAQALSKFSLEFLQDAYVFFVDADLDTCIERIYQRVTSPFAPSNHFVSDYVMHTYYNHENWSYVSSDLKRAHHIFKDVQSFRNTGNVCSLLETVGDFAEQLFQTEFHAPPLSKQQKQLAPV